MFKHLIVPLDGSSLAESVLPVATLLAKSLHARLTLLHIIEQSPPAQVHGEPHLMNAKAATTYLQNLAQRIGEPNLNVATDCAPAQNNVAQSILERAIQLQADLILLCAHGRGRLRDVLVGSIAQQVLYRGEIPVLVIRPPAISEKFALKNILVPLDGRSVYEPAIQIASELAQAFHAHAHLLVVVPTLNSLTPERAATGTLLPTSTQAMLDLAERGAHEYLAALKSRMEKEQIEATVLVQRGDTVTQILQTADHLPADLIVLATHGRAGLDAFWSGSVAPKILQRTTHPVLLLRVQGEEPVR